MTVLYKLAMCMPQFIFHELLCISIFLQSFVHDLCTVFYSAFSEVAILAAFNVLIISSTRPNGAFAHPTTYY